MRTCHWLLQEAVNLEGAYIAFVMRFTPSRLNLSYAHHKIVILYPRFISTSAYLEMFSEYYAVILIMLDRGYDNWSNAAYSVEYMAHRLNNMDINLLPNQLRKLHGVKIIMVRPESSIKH